MLIIRVGDVIVASVTRSCDDCGADTYMVDTTSEFPDAKKIAFIVLEILASRPLLGLKHLMTDRGHFCLFNDDVGVHVIKKHR